MSDAELPTPAGSGTDPAGPGTAPATRPRRAARLWEEAKGLFWLILAVLLFHSFIAKPFYIPSESMMPVLIKGDRLVVSKYPYGWSYVSPSIIRVPGNIGLWLGRLTGQPDGLAIPFMEGRLFGRLPQRGDIVIVKPKDQYSDYIKRVIGLPGDAIALRQGQIILNGVPVPRRSVAPVMIPVDANVPCDGDLVAPYRVIWTDGKEYCRLPMMRETLPNGVSYDTIDIMDLPQVDDMEEIRVPEGHVFLMGDNRDQSADSRVPAIARGLDGPLPIENIGGRAEFITFSLDGTSAWWNPLSWFSAMRGGRAGTSLRPGPDGTDRGERR